MHLIEVLSALKGLIGGLLAKGYSFEQIKLILAALPAALEKLKGDAEAALQHVLETLDLFRSPTPPSA